MTASARNERDADHPLVAEGAALDRALGDPCTARNPLSHARVVRADELERFPEQDVAVLQSLGYARFCSPLAWERGLCGFESLLGSTRAVARRDLTSAVALGQTMLGALPVLLAGSDEQRRKLSHLIELGALGSLALTEETHGSDLAACELEATPSGDGYVLSGTKWLVGNLTRGSFASVLARTRGRSAGGAPELSLFFLEKDTLPADRFRPLPKLHTHGVRGADVAGIAFESCPLLRSARIAGNGFDLVAKTLQISRILCAGLSLGACDTALRIALDFALERRLYGDSVLEIGAASDELAGAFARLLAGEVLALLGHRAIGLAPECLSLWSPLVKTLVPLNGEAAIASCGRVLGARHYLREGLHCGIFQKLLRDHTVVGLFDGSTAVNLSLLAAQLPALARGQLRPRTGRGHEQAAYERLLELLDVASGVRATRLPAATALRVVSPGNDPLVDALPECIRRAEDAGAEDALLELLRAAHGRARSALHEALALRGTGELKPTSGKAARLAERYLSASAAAACALFWMSNRAAGDAFLRSGDWLIACLELLLNKQISSGREAALIVRARELHRDGCAFSLLRHSVATRAAPAAHTIPVDNSTSGTGPPLPTSW